jgi:hypothetical protein
MICWEPEVPTMSSKDVRNLLDDIIGFARKGSDADVRSGVKEETVGGKRTLVIEGAALEFCKTMAAKELGLDAMYVGNARTMSVQELAEKIVAWNKIPK